MNGRSIDLSVYLPIIYLFTFLPIYLATHPSSIYLSTGFADRMGAVATALEMLRTAR